MVRCSCPLNSTNERCFSKSHRVSYLCCSQWGHSEPLHGFLSVSSFQLCGNKALEIWEHTVRITKHRAGSTRQSQFNCSLKQREFFCLKFLYLKWKESFECMVPRFQRWAEWSSYRCKKEPLQHGPHANQRLVLSQRSCHVSLKSSESLWSLGSDREKQFTL